MEIKHQVFVSSTYKDLIEERKAVIHALLELDCIPAGMELFPAADEDAWTLIREVIDGCDYYVLILAGKYGSTAPTGVGYTEMEFDYAVSVGKPIIAFLHENPETLQATQTEKNETSQQKLDRFREKAKLKHCKFWSGPEDLGAKVSRGLINLRKKHPSPGWVPGRLAVTEATLRETQELRETVARLERELSSKSGPPAGADNLAQGRDPVYLTIKLKADAKGTTKDVTLTANWDYLFSYIGPSLISECTETEMMSRIQLAYWHLVPDDFQAFVKHTEVIVPYVHEDRICVQFQALGLIEPGKKRRAVSDQKRYWKLTPYGETYLISIRAEKKKTPKLVA